jgi:hypothetical protein
MVLLRHTEHLDNFLNAQGTLDLNSLAAHNILEHDASLVHDDYFFNRDVVKVNQQKLARLRSRVRNGFLDLNGVAAHKKEQLLFSQENNLSFELPDHPIRLNSRYQYWSIASIFAVFGNGTHVSDQAVNEFLGQERIPSGYVSNPVGLGMFNYIRGQLISIMDSIPSQILQIPARESAAGLVTRNAQLSAKKNQIVNVPVFITIPNRPGERWNYAMGPNPSSTFWQNAVAVSSENLLARATLASKKVTIALQSIFFGPNKPDISTLDSITNMFQAIDPFIQTPHNFYDWRSDRMFAERTLTYSGYKLTWQPANNVYPISDELSIQITGETFASLQSQYRIFRRLDSAVGTYSKSLVKQANPDNQIVPSTQTVFYLTKENILMPYLIKITQTGLVYTPKDAPYDWEFAKLASSTSAGSFLPTEHFTVNHMIWLGAQTELIRHVSTKHPLYALLNHHFKDNYGNAIVGIKLIIGNGTASDRYFGMGGVGMSKMMEDRFNSYNFKSEKIRNQFLIYGTTTLPNYRYRDDIMANREAIGRFTDRYFRIFYQNDAEVAADQELNNWAAATATTGGLTGFPTSFTSISALADDIADIITHVTVMHAALNGQARWHGQTFPVTPKAIYGGLPTRKGVPFNVRSKLAPTHDLIFAELNAGQAFNIPISQENALGWSYGYELGDAARPAVEQFQADLQAVSDRINAREATQLLKYDILDPKKIPSQVWI